MKKCDLLLDEKYELNIDDAFNRMFECIDENGKLCIQNFPNDFFEIDSYIVCDFKFTEEQKKSALKEFKEIIDSIISYHQSHSIDSDSVKFAYETYIKDLADFNDRIGELHLRWLEDDESYANFNSEEIDILEKYRDDCRTEIRKRMGDNYCAYETYNRGKRFYRLLELKAPNDVSDYETILFLKAFLINKFATSFEIIDK